MAYGLSLATMLTVPVTHYFLRMRPSLPDRETFHQLWSFARHSTVSATLGQVYSRLDILLLGALLTPAAAGQYEVALKLTMPAILVSDVMRDGLVVRVSNLQSKGEAVGADVTNALSFASVLAIPLFAGATVLSQPLVVTVYGPEYAEASTLLIGLGLYRVFVTQSGPLSETLNGIDRPDINVRIAAGTLALNVVLGVALTLHIGAVGVVIATVIAEGLKYAATGIAVSRLVEDVTLLPSTLLEQVGAAVGMAAAVFLVRDAVGIQSWLTLLAVVGLGVAIYGFVLLVLSEQLRHTVLNILSDAGLTKWLPDSFNLR
jgi:O-antigen/teichoic acid export membrane protein